MKKTIKTKTQAVTEADAPTPEGSAPNTETVPSETPAAPEAAAPAPVTDATSPVTDMVKALVKTVAPDVEIDEEKIASIVAEFQKMLADKFSAGQESVKAEAKEEAAQVTEAALKEFDAEMTKKLVETIDKVEESYSKMVEKLTEKANGVLTKHIPDMPLVEKIHSFLNTFLKDSLKEEVVVEAEKTKRLAKFYENIREAVFVSNDVIDQKIAEKTAVMESEVKKLNESLQAALKDKVTLTEQVTAVARKEMLVEATKNCAPAIAAKVVTFFKDSSLKDIKESCETVIKRFEGELDSARATAAANTTSTAAPRAQTLNESTTSSPNTPKSVDLMEIYASQAASLSRMS